MGKPAALPPEVIAARLAALPHFYGYRDVLDQVFAGDVDALVDALCDQTLPPAALQACLDTMQPRTLEIWLLRRIVRQLNVLIAQGEPLHGR